MTKPIIYIDTDNLNILMESEYGDPQGKTDLTVEYTDIPYWAVLHFTETGKTVTVYRRPDLHMPKEEISTRLGQVTDNGSGKVDISAVPELRESIGSLYWGCLLICDMLQKEDPEAVQPEEQEDDETHEENYTGILVRNEKGKWKRIPVAGKTRPDLMASLFFGGEAMCRPYMEDVMERDLRQAGADRDLREAVHWYGESYKQTRAPKTAAKLQLLKC